jgi:hypothetical protein
MRTAMRLTKIRQVTRFIKLTLMHVLIVGCVHGVGKVHKEYASADSVTLHSSSP